MLSRAEEAGVVLDTRLRGIATWTEGRAWKGWGYVAGLVGYGSDEGYLVDLTQVAVWGASTRIVATRHGEQHGAVLNSGDYGSVADHRFYVVFGERVSRLRTVSKVLDWGVLVAGVIVIIAAAVTAVRRRRQRRHARRAAILRGDVPECEAGK
jgi:hypothetical protein